MIWGCTAFAAAWIGLLSAAVGLWPAAGCCLLCLIAAIAVGLTEWVRA